MALTKLKSGKRRASKVNKGMIKKAKKLGKKRRREGDDDKSAILAKSERREEIVSRHLTSSLALTLPSMVIESL